jgi:hypothetical protein
MLDALLAAGDPAFLADVELLTDPARLRALARSWCLDAGAPARALLLRYLDGLLNPFHEPLVLRLFRRAVRAGDDEVMGRFLLLFDRSLRRKRGPGGRWTLSPSGFVRGEVVAAGGFVRGEAIGDAYLIDTPGGARVLRLSEQQRRDYEAYRLFAVPTRLLLRRRTWRYFDRLGRDQPQRYVPALVGPLLSCTDGEIHDEASFLDHWGLLHVLFRHSEHLHPRRGSIAWQDIPPAPAHEDLWRQCPDVLLRLATDAPCRLVSRWAGRLLQRQPPEVLARLSSVDLVNRLKDHRAETAATVARVLLGRGERDDLPVETWLSLLEVRGDWALSPILELCDRFLAPERLSMEQAVSLACSATPEVAHRSWRNYVGHHLMNGAPDPEVLLRLLAAPVAPLREEMAGRLRVFLAEKEQVSLPWLGAYLDSPHTDVRAEGLRWAREDRRFAEEPAVWRRLVSSAHPDLREPTLQALQEYQSDRPRALRDALPLTPENLRTLWARLLLTLHSGWRGERSLVRQLVGRLQWKPEEAGDLLPMLGVLLQLLKGSAWREALAGVVALVERHPEWEEAVTREAPGLVLRPPLAAEGAPSLP